MTDSQGDSTTGTGAIVSAIISAIGIMGVLHPHWVWLGQLSQYKDDLRNVLPVLLTALGTVGAAISHPPAWAREPWDDLKYYIASHFRRPPTV